MTVASPQAYSKERIRIAVLFFFVAQGLCFSAFFSRLPDIKEQFNINSISHLGWLLTLLPIGKFLAIPVVGFLLPRIKSKYTTLISLVGFIVTLFVLGLICQMSALSNIYVLGVFLFFFGTFWNMTDISLNTQAIEVEHVYGKPIISTFHAGWSIAACVGALIGYLMININASIFTHIVFISTVCLLMVLINGKYLQEEQKVSKEPAEVKPLADKASSGWKFKLPETLLIQLGIIWLLALIVENTIFDWSDIYFQSVIKAPESLRIGFLICMVMISIGRFLANSAYRLWSKTTVLKLAGIFLFAGFMITAIFYDINPLWLRLVVNSFGFTLIGLGISCVVPTLYSIVGEKSKTPAGTALTIMSSISFIGPLVAPSLVGEISHYWGMEYAYMVIGLLGLCIVGIATVSKSLRK